MFICVLLFIKVEFFLACMCVNRSRDPGGGGPREEGQGNVSRDEGWSLNPIFDTFTI